MSVKSVIARFVSVWGMPNTANPDQFLAEFRRSFENTSDELLEKAADELIDKSKFWPRPGDMHETIREIISRAPSPTLTAVPKTEQLPERSPDEIERARRLMEEFRRTAEALAAPPDLNTKTPKFPNRDEFRAMQERSPNTHLHLDS